MKTCVVGVATLAVLGLSACSHDDPPPPPPGTTTTATATETPPPSDLTFSGVSVNEVVEGFEEVLGHATYDVKYATVDGDAVQCPEESITAEGSEAQMVLCSDLQTLIIPERTDFGQAPPRVGVWFFIVKQLALEEFDEVGAECVAGYVIQRTPAAGFVTEDMALLKDYLVDYADGTSMYEAALYGINFSQKGQPISTCASSSQGGDRETP